MKVSCILLIIIMVFFSFSCRSNYKSNYIRGTYYYNTDYDPEEPTSLYLSKYFKGNKYKSIQIINQTYIPEYTKKVQYALYWLDKKTKGYELLNTLNIKYIYIMYHTEYWGWVNTTNRYRINVSSTCPMYMMPHVIMHEWTHITQFYPKYNKKYDGKELEDYCNKISASIINNNVMY